MSMCEDECTLNGNPQHELYNATLYNESGETIAARFSQLGISSIPHFGKTEDEAKKMICKVICVTEDQGL